MMTYKKSIYFLGAIVLLQGCTWYGEFEHVSSIPNGSPFNNREETSVDVLWTGIKVEKDGWYVDSAIGWDTSSEYQGRNPYGRFKVGKEIKKWPTATKY